MGYDNGRTGLARTTLLTDTNRNAGVSLMCPALRRLRFSAQRINDLIETSLFSDLQVQHNYS